MQLFSRGNKRHWRFPLPALVGLIISLSVLLEGGGISFFSHPKTQASTIAFQSTEINCTLIVPPYPLSAAGLATPYQLVATNPADGSCHEANPNQAAFVEGGIFDFSTDQFSIYNPLVIDQGTEPAIKPVTPHIPKNAVVALWFGFNGDTLTLQSSPNTNSLQEGQCVNGAKDSLFGQFAYCNAALFFGEVNQAIDLGMLTVPPLGMAKDGDTCPSVRDFGVVDQDQSDNVTSGYLVATDGKIAQLTGANQQSLPNAQPLTNGSDNGLLNAFVDPALGCTPWMAPDLANEGQMTTSLALNEIQARQNQKAPVAFVPLNDPMVLDAQGNFSLAKVNAYRAGVDQPRVLSNNQADPKAYCQHLVDTGAPRIVRDAFLLIQAATPDTETGNTLFTFLAQRFVNSYKKLKCQELLDKASPITTIQDKNGIAINATYNDKPINTVTQAPNCNVNGQTINGCSGTATINGQACTLAFLNNAVTITCPKPNS